MTSDRLGRKGEKRLCQKCQHHLSYRQTDREKFGLRAANQHLPPEALMTMIETIAPELFGFWPHSPAYAAEGWSETKTRSAVEEYFLETKSGESAPAEDLRVMLNQMTTELREQFTAFRDLRRAAEAAAAETGDEAAAKLARADLKAAADAMSLIVRTLEKVDQLQRQFARDRELEAERQEDVSGYVQARTQFLALIDQRAAEKAEQLFAERLAEWERTRDAEVAAGADPPDKTLHAPGRGDNASQGPEHRRDGEG